MSYPSYAEEVAAEHREHREPDIARCSTCDAKLTEENTEDRYADQCDACHQKLEEQQLSGEIERIAGELAEALDEYHKARVLHAESGMMRSRYIWTREALAIMRRQSVAC